MVLRLPYLLSTTSSLTTKYDSISRVVEITSANERCRRVGWGGVYEYRSNAI